MISRKMAIISIIITVFVLALFIGLSYYFQYQSAKEMNKKARLFSEKWLTFETQDNPQFLESIKPLITSDFYNTFTSTLETQKNVKGYDQIPKTSSFFKAKTASQKKKNKLEMIYNVSGNLLLKQGDRTVKNKDIELVINYSKINNSWIVSNAYINNYQ